MQRFWLIALFAALATGLAFGQQASPTTPPAKVIAQPERVKVYAVGPGVTAPELLPLSPVPLHTGKCKFKQDGEVGLFFFVDTAGLARDIFFFRPLGLELDRLALRIAGADRFKPGTHEGKPVVVGQSLELKIQSCVEESTDAVGKPISIWKLRSAPKQKLGPLPKPPEEAVLTQDTFSLKLSSRAAARSEYFGAEVTAPVLIGSVDAEYPESAQKRGIKGVCLISLVVDPNGLPENVQVARALDPDLDRSAVDAVKRYRYLPAIRNDEPVSAVITVPVTFAPYEPDLE